MSTPWKVHRHPIHSHHRNFSKHAQFLPLSPHSTLGKKIVQQEINRQEKDKNRHYFCLSERSCIRRGKWKKQPSQQFPICPTQVGHARTPRHKNIIWHPEDKEIECSKAGVCFLNEFRFLIPENSRSSLGRSWWHSSSTALPKITLIINSLWEVQTYTGGCSCWYPLLPPTEDPERREESQAKGRLLPCSQPALLLISDPCMNHGGFVITSSHYVSTLRPTVIRSWEFPPWT
jgi:hypothetical protein